MMNYNQNVLSTTVKLGTPAMRLYRTRPSSNLSLVQLSTLSTISIQTLGHHRTSMIVCNSLKMKTRPPICLFGGKGNSRGENKAFSWDSLKDVVKGMTQKKEVQDILRDQMRRREFGGDDGGGNTPGGRGGGSGGFDGTEDDGSDNVLEETFQVVMAVIALIFVYIYMIKGSSIFMLARDYIKYLFGGVPSMRLQQTMDKWRQTLSQFSYEEPCEDWLERLIVTTPTWWYDPERAIRGMRLKKRREIESKRRQQAQNESDL